MSRSLRKPVSAKLSWYASEISVVVIGVLIALALNAWWQGVQDSRSEEHYYEQLKNNLERTISVHKADSISSARVQRHHMRFNEAARFDSEVSSDSVDSWIGRALTSYVSNISLGAFAALVDTGDLNLISDDSLRFAISDYYDEMINQERSLQLANTLFEQEALRLSEIVDVISLSRRIVDSPTGKGFGLKPTEFLSDEKLLMTMSQMFALQVNLSAKRNVVLSKSRALLALVSMKS